MTKAAFALALLARWPLFALAAYALASLFAGRSVAPYVRRTVFALTALVVLASFASIVTATHFLQQWDFICFWQYGHAAAAHANVYAASAYRSQPLPIPVGDDFRRESIEVGFPYPPPSILLFLPLGYSTNVKVAGVLWLLAMLALFIAGIICLARTYEKSDATMVVAIAGLAFALPATADIIAYHQTSFLAFALVAATYRYRRVFTGGVAAGLAVVVKPYLAILLLWFALRRRWNALAASLGTLVVVTLASLPFIGPGALHDFLFANPSMRFTPSMFAEAETSSLFAFLLRMSHTNASIAAPMHNGPFVALAVVLTAVSLWFGARARDADDDLSLPLFVALALMLYPGTGSMYAIVLVPAIVALARRASTARGVWLVTALAFAFAVANGGGGETTFVAFAALWAILAMLLFRPLERIAALTPSR